MSAQVIPFDLADVRSRFAVGVVRTLDVVDAAAALCDVTPAMIIGPRRGAAISWVRFGVVHVARRYHGLSAIGRVLRRDHSTILHAERRAIDLIEIDPAFAAYVRKLAEAIS